MILCSECDLPILLDDDRVVVEVVDDGSPWHGFVYHEECYEVGR